MTTYDTKLQQLQEQTARRRKLISVTQELRRQRDAFSARVRELEGVMLEEQADVDRLEGRSLAAFFYNVIGKMDEKLDRERREAYEARVKYDAAARELAESEAELRRSEEELDALRGCEERYQAALEEKARAVKARGGADGEKLLELERHIAALDSRKRELDEAVSAGRLALSTAESVLSSLDSAEGWGTWDLLGGGLISDLAKHSHLDEAQGAIEQLQSQLRRFKTELADVAVYADIQVNVDGFLRFADYFFDGLFADWAVLDHIHQSQEQVRDIRNRIGSILSRLEAALDSTRQEQTGSREQLARLVREAQLI